MREFREKRQTRKLIHSNVTLLVLLIITIFIGKGVWNLHLKEREAYSARVEIEREVMDAESRVGFLDREVGTFKTESGIEREIRETLSVKKPGEEVVVILDSTTTREVKEEGSIKNRISSWISNLF